MFNMKECKKGDLLLCKHNTIVKYVLHTPEESVFKHEVSYLVIDGKRVKYKHAVSGTRTDEGYVYSKNRMDCDYDVIEKLPADFDIDKEYPLQT